MIWDLSYSPLAEQDIREAASYYQDVAPNQVERFVRNVRTVTDGLREHPFASIPQPNGLRRHSVNAFPYSVWADIDEDAATILVVGVVHDRRDPSLIEERAQDLREGQ